MPDNAPSQRPAGPVGVLDAVVHLTLAFDIGYEIDLEHARALLAAQSGPLARRRRTPESIQYRPAPLRVPIDASDLALPANLGGSPVAGPPRADLGLFDFGAVSLSVPYPIRSTSEELLRLAGSLADLGPWTDAARRALAPWLERLRPTVSEFEISAIGEEYVVFQLGPIRDGWLREHAAWVAGLVRLEDGPLSAEEVREATRLHISYSPNDAVVLDWAAGLVADRECADTLQVIEFANVQLLEFRHIDDRLDDRLEDAYRLIRPPRRRRASIPWRSHGGAMRRVRELEVEATSLFERTDNALKLIGDQYLSRVFGMASARFHLDGWQRSIRRKLETVGDVFDLLVQQASGTRLEVLEITIVLLIALEIVLVLVRG